MLLNSRSRLYADHLKPLDGLFGFDLSSTKPYQGVSMINLEDFRYTDLFIDAVQVAAQE